MAGKNVIGIIGTVVVLVLGGGSWLFFGGVADGDSGLKVASFNGEIFGDAKISNVGVDYYVDLVKKSGYCGKGFHRVLDKLEVKGRIIRRKVGRSLEVVVI